MILNEMQRYTDFLTMGAQTTGVSLIDFNRTASTMNGLGLVYQMYGDHFAGAFLSLFRAIRLSPRPSIPPAARSAGENLGQPNLSARHVCGA